MSKNVSSYRGLHKLNELVFSLNQPLLGKKGLHYHKLLKDWAYIVGPSISRYAIPTKISTLRQKKTPENILYIATNNSASATELVYHLGILKEQINFYFGYDYINQIKITQAVFQVTHHKEPLETPKLNDKQQQKLSSLVSEYKGSDEIKDILINFAKIIVSRE